MIGARKASSAGSAKVHIVIATLARKQIVERSTSGISSSCAGNELSQRTRFAAESSLVGRRGPICADPDRSSRQRDRSISAPSRALACDAAMQRAFRAAMGNLTPWELARTLAWSKMDCA
jgi:hypothetical protein